MAAKVKRQAVKVFTDISEILTLKGAAKKSGRRVLPEDLSILKKAALVVEGTEIKWVGSESRLPSAYKRAKKISLNHKTVLPAFVECHTHSVFAGSRADEFEMRNQGASYQEIAEKGGGILSTVKATRRAKLEDLVSLAQKRMQTFLKQGVTTVEIKSGYGLNLKTEKKMLEAARSLKKIRVVPTYLGAHAIAPEKSSKEEYVNELISRDLPQIAKSGLAKRVDIFIEKGYFDIEDGRRYLQTAKDLGLEISVHADQLNRTGATRLAIEMEAKSVDHVIEISDEDIGLLAKSDTTAVFLPGADVYIRTPFPPARKLIEAGARVALATDFNPGSCPTQNLSWVGFLARHEMKMTLAEVIAAYTLGGAYTLGLQNELGSLEIGKMADFTVIDGSWKELFFGIGHMPVASVWSKGIKRA